MIELVKGWNIDATEGDWLRPVKAEWNSNCIAGMTDAQSLRNFCLQLEQGYVQWSWPGSPCSRDWPHSSAPRLRFITTKRRSIQVETLTGRTVGTCKMRPGLAAQLHALALKALGTTL